MSDAFDMQKVPGADAASNSLNSATDSFQKSVTEIQRMSQQAIERTQATMQQIKNAKTAADIVSIQASYMQQSFASYVDYTRRFSELMIKLPLTMARQSRDAIQQGIEATTKITQQAGEQLQDASRDLNKHIG